MGSFSTSVFILFLLLQACVYGSQQVTSNLADEPFYILQKGIQEMSTAGQLDTTAHINVRRAINCMSLCDSANEKCLSGIYNSVNKTCHLYNDDIEVAEGRTNNITYFQKSTGIAYERVENAALMEPHSTRTVYSVETCKTLCSLDETCAAFSYNNISSVCARSGRTDVVRDQGDDIYFCVHVKEAYFKELRQHTLRKDLTAGAAMTFSSDYAANNEHGVEKAIDGIYLPVQYGYGEGYSIAVTDNELSPWIQADILTNYYVFEMEIWDRSEAANPVMNDRLANVRVTVGESDANFDDPPEDEICNYLPGQPPADQFLVTCNTRMYGRYVRMTAVEVNTCMNIYEIEIHGFLI